MPTTTFAFDAAWVLTPGIALIVLFLGLMGWKLRQRGLSVLELGVLLLLRGLLLAGVLLLVARPVSVHSLAKQTDPYVSVVLDRSLSMSLEEDNRERYQRVVDLLKDKLAPALTQEGWKIRPWLFAETAKACTAAEISTAEVNGTRTNLAGALFQAATAGAEPPVAIVALTDGDANDNSENTKAVSALFDRQIPVFAIGIGSDAGPSTLTLQKVTAPSVAPTKEQFRISAQLSMSGTGQIPNFELLLLRDGQLLQTKTITGFTGSRTWSETFPVTENEEGRHNYKVQLTPPEVTGLVLGQQNQEVQVNISNENNLRVLYVQGALTWDYKFILRALHSDPAVRVTGLSRTSDHSTYRQNVEKAGELIEGFPTSLDQLAPYRVVVISNLKARDLTPAQQEILTRFCGELGGGVLLLGGPETFDNSWQGTGLEKLLPVTLDPNPGVTGLDRPFHLKVTDEALRNPVFQITDNGTDAAAWQSLPTFSQYGRVESAKPGALIWAEHEDDVGPDGKPRILMAGQSYGAGRSAVICVQNFWRWRLAKDSDPAQFDRFWRQLFRYLGEAGRQSVLIDFTDQQLEPPTDLHVMLERQAAPADLAAPAAPAVPSTPSATAADVPKMPVSYTVVVHGPDQKEIFRQAMDLPAGQPIPFSFHAEAEGFYSIAVLNAQNLSVAERSVQLLNSRIEMERTGRDMENLKQWASLTQGAAFTEEECRDIGPLIAAIHQKIALAEQARTTRLPLGLDGWILASLLGLLAAEWLLRKRWNLL